MIDRAPLRFLQERRRHAALDFAARPLEAGCGGCPWRVVLAWLLRRNADQAVAARVLGALLQRWPTPHELARADRWEVRQLCELLNGGPRRARLVQRFSKGWIDDDWQTLTDLAHLGCGRAAAEAVQRWCFKGDAS